MRTDKGQELPEQKILLGQVVREWQNSMKLWIKESSYVKYHNVIQNHIVPALGELSIDQITTEAVEAFAHQKLSNGSKRGAGGLSEKTVRDMITILKGICQYAECRDWPVPCHFERIKIKSRMSEIRILSTEEQRQLEALLMQDESPIKTGILISLYMGLRLGEVCALQKRHLIHENRIMQVRLTMQRIQNLDGGGRRTKIIITEPKSSSSIRDIPVPPFLRNRLNALGPMPEDAFLLTGRSGRFVEPRTMQNVFRRCLQQCEMSPITYHALRHTFATRCVEQGFDIKSLSEILGHANVNITLNRYVHSSMEQKIKNMEKLALIRS